MSRWRRKIVVLIVACLAVVELALVAGAPAPVQADDRQLPVHGASGCHPAGGVAVPEAPLPASSGIIVRGHGWGHGLGMSQYGAQGAARLGCNHAQILGTYYSGTRLERRSLTAPVVAALKEGAVRATALAENGRVVWVSPEGTSLVQPAGQAWTVHGYVWNGTVGTVLLDGAGARRLFVPTGTLRLAHATVTVRIRTYPVASNTPSSDTRVRWGTAGFTRTVDGYAVDETIASDARGTSVDKYLWGLGEMPVSWPGEALRSQSDAARTYLARALSGGAYQIGVTTAAQVYAGATREDEDARYRYPWRTAVSATSGEVIVDSSGNLITAMYFSSDGGRSLSRAEVYGSQGGFGYLSGVDDSRWDLASSNPHRSWATAFTPEQFATALGFGTVTGIGLAALGTADRAEGMKVTGTVDGATRTITFTGAAARTALGLRSPAFTVTWLPPSPDGGVARSGTVPAG